MSRRVASARNLGWLAMLFVVAVALVVGVNHDAGPRSPEERARSIASSVACPTCAGQSVADSDSTAARGIRSFIDDRVAEGATDDQIDGELTARFGEDILLTPRGSGIAALVWVLPVAAVVVALAGIGFAFYRWRRARTLVPPSDADRALVETALDELRTRP